MIIKIHELTLDTDLAEHNQVLVGIMNLLSPGQVLPVIPLKKAPELERQPMQHVWSYLTYLPVTCDTRYPVPRMDYCKQCGTVRMTKYESIEPSYSYLSIGSTGVWSEKDPLCVIPSEG